MRFRRPTAIVEPVWLDAHAAAAYCGCHRETIRRAYRAGALQGFPIGRGLRFRREHLDAWITAGGRTATRVMTDDDATPLTAAGERSCG